jgi:hypothetical protein
MSGAPAAPNKNMLSGMEPLLTLNGDEFVEVVKRAIDGKYKNYRVLASKLRDASTAYDFAVENGFQGTLGQWLDCTRALYTPDPASNGKVFVADTQGIGQWVEVNIGIVEGLQEELDRVLSQIDTSTGVAADAATAARLAAEQTAADVVESTAVKNTTADFATAAQTSAQQAASSKTAAQGSSSTAQTAATQAIDAKDAAETFAANAEGSFAAVVAAKDTAVGAATTAVSAKDEAVSMRPVIDEMTEAAEVALASTNAALTETRNARDAVVGAEAELDLMKLSLAAITADPTNAVVSWELGAKDFNLVQGGATFKAVAARLAGWSMPDEVASYLTTVVSLPSHWATMDIYVKWVNEVANVGNCVLGGEIHKWKVGETMNATPAGGSGVMAANPSPYIVIESKVASALVLDPTRMTTIRIARQGASVNDTLLNAMTIFSIRLVKTS